VAGIGFYSTTGRAFASVIGNGICSTTGKALTSVIVEALIGG